MHCYYGFFLYADLNTSTGVAFAEMEQKSNVRWQAVHSQILALARQLSLWPCVKVGKRTFVASRSIVSLFDDRGTMGRKLYTRIQYLRGTQTTAN